MARAFLALSYLLLSHLALAQSTIVTQSAGSRLIAPPPGAYSHVFSFRSQRNNIEFLPLAFTASGGWLNYMDDAYDEAAIGSESVSPFLGSFTKVTVLPTKVGDQACAWELKYAIAPGVWTWWVLLNPNTEESDKPVVLKTAFKELFDVVTGAQPLRQWTLPTCMSP